MPGYLYLESLGCPKNRVDSEVMAGLLQQAGYELVEKPDSADLIVLNTCAFIADAIEESIDRLLELAEYRRKGSARRFVLAGCLSKRFLTELRDELGGEVDCFLGPGDYHRILEALDGPPGQALVTETPVFVADHQIPRLNSMPFYTAYLRIAEGCSCNCSYCTIPDIRGPFRSRQPDSLLLEAARLAALGARELTLVAQDSTRYGRDLSPAIDLATLLERLGQVQGLAWIRVMYANPSGVNRRLIGALASTPGIVPYLDMPIQHVSDRLLRAMNRPDSGDSILVAVERLKEAVPGICLRTTVMVGFPGETDDDFRQLQRFIGRGLFEHVGIFPYSREPGTKAADEPEQVPEAERQARYNELTALAQELQAKRHRARRGQLLPVMFEGRAVDAPYLMRGRHAGQAPEIDGLCYIANVERPPDLGTIVTMRVTGADGADLVGEYVEEKLSSVPWVQQGR